MGRPPEGSETRSERITLRITPKGRKALRDVLRDGEDEADAVREGIALVVTKRSAGRAAEQVRAALRERS